MINLKYMISRGLEKPGEKSSHERNQMVSSLDGCRQDASTPLIQRGKRLQGQSCFHGLIEARISRAHQTSGAGEHLDKDIRMLKSMMDTVM